uniref:PEROXIDASE_4 domain-containing protein n=1 Tax=Macrostomum lignano TaxID=282301 RepID=A0A1I8F2J3_9PLAT
PWSRSRTNYSNSLCRARISLVQGVWTASSAWHFGGRSGSWRRAAAGSPVRPAASLPGHHADSAAATGGPAAAVRRESGSCATWQQFPDDGAALLMLNSRLNWQSQAKQVFCTALQRLYRGAITEAHKGLVFNYLGGRFHGGDSAGRGTLFCPDVIRGDSDGSDDYVDLLLASREPSAVICAATATATGAWKARVAAPARFESSRASGRNVATGCGDVCQMAALR